MLHKYSPTETRLLKLLSKKPISTGTLTGRFYQGRAKPLHGQGYVSNSMRGLIRKAKLNREKFKIMRQSIPGSREFEFWRDR